MSTFAYGRVSTADQTAENQRLEIEQAGHAVEYWFADEGVSGKVAASQRPQFRALLEKIRDGETLIVAKLDRLGRDAIDVQQTLRTLASRHIKVFVLQLGEIDLNSSAGKLLVTMLSAVAEMERDLLIERTQAGLQRAKAEGKTLGRKPKLSDEQLAAIRAAVADNQSIASIAKQYGVSRQAIYFASGKATRQIPGKS